MGYSYFVSKIYDPQYFALSYIEIIFFLVRSESIRSSFYLTDKPGSSSFDVESEDWEVISIGLRTPMLNSGENWFDWNRVDYYNSYIR